MKSIVTILLAFTSFIINAQVLQDTTKITLEPAKPEKVLKWYETMKIKGYAQFRYNRVLETNPFVKCVLCDKSIGNNNGFFIRRARLVFSGNPHERVFFYFQPDFASNVAADKQHFLQIRDCYFDLGLDRNMIYRLRIGQSKVPFGFENLQSSSNRIAIDRSDAINTAVPNERDLGVFFYWTPLKYQTIFKELQNSQLKGTGNYGLVAFGAYNGQTSNFAETNNNQHLVARLAYPAKINNQILEAGFHTYSGRVIVNKTSEIIGETEFTDQRIGANLILYPKPFGIQAEWNQGKGPSFNPSDSTIILSAAKGGYAQVMYNIRLKDHYLIPYIKYQVYEGGKKHEQDARYYNIDEWEIGIEWQPIKYFEFTAGYAIMDRTFEDYSKPMNTQKGRLLRLQAQVNF